MLTLQHFMSAASIFRSCSHVGLSGPIIISNDNELAAHAFETVLGAGAECCELAVRVVETRCRCWALAVCVVETPGAGAGGVSWQCAW